MHWPGVAAFGLVVLVIVAALFPVPEASACACRTEVECCG